MRIGHRRACPDRPLELAGTGVMIFGFREGDVYDLDLVDYH